MMSKTNKQTKRNLTIENYYGDREDQDTNSEEDNNVKTSMGKTPKKNRKWCQAQEELMEELKKELKNHIKEVEEILGKEMRVPH